MAIAQPKQRHEWGPFVFKGCNVIFILSSDFFSMDMYSEMRFVQWLIFIYCFLFPV